VRVARRDLAQQEPLLRDGDQRSSVGHGLDGWIVLRLEFYSRRIQVIHGDGGSVSGGDW
jgi:hypothetical protein